MLVSSLDYFFRCFADEQMHLLYTGDFSDLLTDRLIELNNHQYTSEGEFKISQRKASFLIAECFQNIVRHSDTSNEDSYFHIKNDKGLFSIISGNTIESSLIPTLKGQLEQLNKLTSEELKEVYRKTLFDGKFSEKGGAGLGLIEMARRSKNKLSYNFADIDEQKAYFYFQIHHNSENASDQAIPSSIDSSIVLKRNMQENDLFLVYKGVISTPVTVAILGMIENTFESITQKVVFIKLMEFFEKVSELPLAEQEGNSSMLFVGENDINFNVGVSCLLAQQKSHSINRTLALYKSFSKEQLNSEYNRLLKEGSQTAGYEYNLYFIEILRNSLSFEVDVRSYSDNLSYVTFIVGFEKIRRKAKSATKVEIEQTENISQTEILSAFLNKEQAN